MEAAMKNLAGALLVIAISFISFVLSLAIFGIDGLQSDGGYVRAYSVMLAVCVVIYLVGRLRRRRVRRLPASGTLVVTRSVELRYEGEP
jgi:hypothetical protein